jgi:hypothetical protein
MKPTIAHLKIQEDRRDGMPPFELSRAWMRNSQALLTKPIRPNRERALAAGVLRQAASDLRRFHEADDAVGREMHSDARSWFNSNDREWPFSFLNVCELLGISPEDIRDEVFADARTRWLSHSRRVALATATQFLGSVSTLFSSRRSCVLALPHS